MTCWGLDVPVRQKANQEDLRDSERELYDKPS